MISKALILAAGDGKRLDRPNTPKPLVRVGEIPLIFRLIEQMIDAGIDTVYVVVGYEKEKIIKAVSQHFVTRVKLHFLKNDAWSRGIISSAWLGHEVFGGDEEPFLLSMGDHIFDPAHVQTMVQTSPKENTVRMLVDPRSVPDDVLESDVKVLCTEDKIISIDFGLDDYNGVDAGLFAVRPACFFNALNAARADDKLESLPAAMQRIADQGALFSVPMKSGQWCDVDTPVDLVAAEMDMRQARRVGSVRQVTATNEQFDSFDFVAGKAVVTQMLVGRGIFRDPFSIDVIPPESASSPIFVFTDETVAALYGRSFDQALREAGYRSHLLVMKDGEESKSLSSYVELTEKVLSLGVDERSVFISVGGGVVCNVCGFIASTIYRGLDLVHFPTSLMAQCDAAISHKQAINGYMGKNMVGSYFSPRMVAVDVETLLTLDERLMHDGMSEVIKHALGHSQVYVDLLMNHHGDFVRDLDLLEAVIRRNVEHKCQLSTDDPKELAAGMILQYGHTIGHPVEHLSGYSLYHGESVAIGMMVAARVSRIMGACSDDFVRLHEALIAKFGLPTRVPSGISSEDMLRTLKYNKRYLTEGTRMALLSDVGEMWQVRGDHVIPVPVEVLVEAFEQTKE